MSALLSGVVPVARSDGDVDGAAAGGDQGAGDPVSVSVGVAGVKSQVLHAV